ncbi:MAG: hypothetical protein GTO63_22845 [Anaerolineae bacterium]|nr:hypothetical protein [Anaerolineae bacterium]
MNPLLGLGIALPFTGVFVYLILQGYFKGPLEDLLLVAWVALPAFMIGLLGWVGVAYGIRVDSRRRERHEEGSQDYPLQLGDWRPCGACGEPMAADERTCGACGWSLNALPGPVYPWSLAKLRRLPTLRLAKTFSQQTPQTRLLATILAFILPAIMIGAALWIMSLNNYRLDTVPLLLLGFGGTLAVGFTHGFFLREEIVLGPNALLHRKLLGGESLAPSEVDRVLTYHKGEVWVHFFATRGGKSLGIGPGVSPKDFEVMREWIRQFAAIRGIPYWENLTLQDGLRVLRRESKERRLA